MTMPFVDFVKQVAMSQPHHSDTSPAAAVLRELHKQAVAILNQRSCAKCGWPLEGSTAHDDQGFQYHPRCQPLVCRTTEARSDRGVS